MCARARVAVAHEVEPLLDDRLAQRGAQVVLLARVVHLMRRPEHVHLCACGARLSLQLMLALTLAERGRGTP